MRKIMQTALGPTSGRTTKRTRTLHVPILDCHPYVEMDGPLATVGLLLSYPVGDQVQYRHVSLFTQDDRHPVAGETDNASCAWWKAAPLVLASTEWLDHTFVPLGDGSTELPPLSPGPLSLEEMIYIFLAEAEAQDLLPAMGIRNVIREGDTTTLEISLSWP